ncbi:FxsA family protein [Marinobacter sp.]|uniref:FxsA family protein n=1 Tax=Marinobacter sp. TaxID=50741 RepID=UPI001B501B4C|nr:FxsA family protein [Marinobacter sp.]MBQ0831252.1 FxsA family protein [Marinobacter sp.]
MSILLFVFIIMPIAEMAVLIQVGGMIGVFNTIGFVLLTAVLGAWLLRQQGMATLLKANQRLNSGELPAKEVAEGLILAVGGVLLITPGFITDTIGFLCLIPFTRYWLSAWALKRMVASSKNGGFYFRAGSGQSPFGRDPFGDRNNPFGQQRPFDRDGNGDIIEGEYRDETKTDHERLDKK